MSVNDTQNIQEFEENDKYELEWDLMKIQLYEERERQEQEELQLILNKIRMDELQEQEELELALSRIEMTENYQERSSNNTQNKMEKMEKDDNIQDTVNKHEWKLFDENTHINVPKTHKKTLSQSQLKELDEFIKENGIIGHNGFIGYTSKLTGST